MWVNSSDQYQQFCERHRAVLPFYYQPWWLNAAAGTGAWIPFITDDATQIWPVFVKKAGPLAYATTPPLTPRLSFWPPVLPTDAPPLPYAIIRPSVHQLTTRSYYSVPPAEESIQWQNTHTLAKRQIRSAQKNLQICSETDSAILYDLVQKSMQRNQIKLRWSANWLQRVFSAAQSQNQTRIWLAKDSQQQIHAAIWVVWDQCCMYYLAGGMDHQLTQTGASRYLLWNAMRLAAEWQLDFDFGGGMKTSVGQVYASLGGIQHNYFRPFAYRYDWMSQGIRWIKNIYAPHDRLFH